MRGSATSIIKIKNGSLYITKTKNGSLSNCYVRNSANFDAHLFRKCNFLVNFCGYLSCAVFTIRVLGGAKAYCSSSFQILIMLWWRILVRGMVGILPKKIVHVDNLIEWIPRYLYITIKIILVIIKKLKLYMCMIAWYGCLLNANNGSLFVHKIIHVIINYNVGILVHCLSNTNENV